MANEQTNTGSDCSATSDGKMSKEKTVHAIYRELRRITGRDGVHRGMTSLTRDEWRAESVALWRSAERINQLSRCRSSG
jgi:hypothetical protein